MAKAKKATKKATNGKRTVIIAAAKELNELLEPEPAIPVKGKTDDILAAITTAGELVEEDDLDVLSEDTIDVLRDVGCEVVVLDIEDEDEDEEDIEDEDEEDIEDEEEEDIEEEKPKKKTKKKTKSTRAEVMAEIVQTLPKTGNDKGAIVAKMNRAYGGSANEAAFYVGQALSLLSALGIVERNEKGKYTRA